MIHACEQVGAVCVGLLLLLGLSGCTSAGESGLPETSTQSTTSLSAEQEEALADGSVSRDEYDAGFRRYSSCIEKEGFVLVDVREEYQVISYGIPAEAVDSGVEARCYSAEFEQIDTAWQISVEDEGKYAIIFANCLAEQGLDTTGTRLEKENRLAAAGITVDECLDSQE